MAVNIQYKAKITVKWILGKEEYDIENSSIQTILITHDYDNLNLPLIYIILNLKSSMYTKMVNNEDKKILSTLWSSFTEIIFRER